MEPVILLPPSETKHAGGTGSFDPASGHFFELARLREEVAAALAAAMDDPATRAGITGLSGERAEIAATSTRRVLGAPVLPAGARYAGVVWSQLDPTSLSPRGRRRALGIVVVSGLGGLFCFDDPVPSYKLKMGARLAPLGVLANLWRPAITSALGAFAEGRVVWDLLPNEHRRALELDASLGMTRIRVDLLVASGARAAGHRSKAAKGAFARHLLEARTPQVEAAQRFSWMGWRAELARPDLLVIRSPD